MSGNGQAYSVFCIRSPRRNELTRHLGRLDSLLRVTNNLVTSGVNNPLNKPARPDSSQRHSYIRVFLCSTSEVSECSFRTPNLVPSKYI